MPFGFELEPRTFFRPGSAALDEAPNRKAVVAAIDAVAPPLFLRGPADLGEAAIQGDLVIAAIEASFLENSLFAFRSEQSAWPPIIGHCCRSVWPYP